MMLKTLFLSPALLAQLSLGLQPTAAQDSTTFALVYGYPLLAFQTLADRFLQYNVSNFLFHYRELSTADNRTVVRPNVDTLYSAVLYDLSQADLAIQVPEIADDQFVLFSFYDPFGDNYANFGTGSYQQSGKYLLSRPLNGTFEVGLVPRYRSIESPEIVADVFSPTTYGIILIRWLVDSTNLDTIHQLQDQTNISPNNRTTIGEAPALTSLNTPDIVSKGTPAEQVLNLVAAYNKWNQPWSPDVTALVAEELESAGILGNGYTVPEGTDLEAANRSALASISAAATNASNLAELNNGWSITQTGIAGDFLNGTNFAYRAAVAASGYLMLQTEIAIYPSWTNASDPGQTSDDGSFELGPDDAWVYTFSRKPPLQTAGFWSITVYADNYLVPNDLNRYQAGDRSNLTYPDGSAVYGKGASDEDGAFQVLVQAADKTPPTNWTNNWIPGPAGGGSIGVWLRFYLAQDELVNGTYEYPVVERRPAIVSGDNDTSDSPTATSSAGNTGSASSSVPSTTASDSSASKIANPRSSYSILALVLACTVAWIEQGQVF